MPDLFRNSAAHVTKSDEIADPDEYDPDSFDDEMANEIIYAITEGRTSLTALCDFPSNLLISTVAGWISANPNFATRLNEAFRMRSRLHIERLIDLQAEIEFDKIGIAKGALLSENLRFLAAADDPVRFGNLKPARRKSRDDLVRDLTGGIGGAL